MRMRQRQRLFKDEEEDDHSTTQKRTTKKEKYFARARSSLLVMEAGLLCDLHLLAQVEQDVGELLLRATDEIFMKPRRDGVGGDDRWCAWRDGVGAGARATINEGRKNSNGVTNDSFSVCELELYRADEAVSYL